MIGSPGKLVTNGRTNGRTDGSEFIGPTSKVGGSKNQRNLMMGSMRTFVADRQTDKRTD